MKVDPADVANPYDFANPVSKSNRFYGREAEMADIRYYLDLAGKADRPINLALLGDRAAGKTSILNIISLAAKERGYHVARIDLDEDDATSQSMFFFKVFDAALTAVCQNGVFGGLSGKTFQTYVSITNTFEVPEDKLFCPFLFPISYALAMKSGNASAPVSDTFIKHDFAYLAAEAKKPIVLLFDESNVLLKSRVLLEKIRNAFMNIAGFMTVLTGTRDLFPVMDDVFSPIIRQFKKIVVEEFKDSAATGQCVLNPLKLASLSTDIVRTQDIEEIHTLTGGRPYEIQLVCHLMFRRIQSKRARRMSVSLGVLEDLRRELEQAQDISSRRVPTVITSLDKQELLALAALTRAEATFEELWGIDYIIEDDEQPWSKEQLREHLDKFKRLDILKEDDSVIRFKGDQFDILYAKYYAREQKVILDIRPLNAWAATVVRLMQAILQTKSPATSTFGEGSSDYIQRLSALTSDDAERDLFSDIKIGDADEIYFAVFDKKDAHELVLGEIRLSLPWADITASIRTKGNSEEEFRKLCSETKISKARVEELGGKLEYHVNRIALPKFERLVEALKTTANQELRNEVGRKHGERVSTAYVRGELALAVENATLARQYTAELPSQALNNIGYVMLAIGREDIASEMFQAARKAAETSQEIALADYNAALIKMLQGDKETAKQLLVEAAEQAAKLSDDDKQLLCLFLPVVIEDRLTMKESRDPDLLVCVEGALAMLPDLPPRMESVH